jgi:hypothetical protein
MKRENCPVAAVLFAAAIIIGCSAHALICAEKRRLYQQRFLEEAVQNWEGEGGAVVPEPEEAM